MPFIKLIYILLATFFCIRLYFIYSFKKNNNPKTSYKGSILGSPDTSKPLQKKLDENPYDGLKRLAYSTQYSQLNLPAANGKEVLYGVIMDWDYQGKATITLVAFRTGDVSLYFSTGAAILGAGQHADVNTAGKAFIDKAETLLANADPMDTALRTEKGVLKFYLLTNERKYAIKDKVDNVYNHTSPLSAMFEEANKLIGDIRTTEERMQQQGGNH
jgi:hypothetical protein